ncbi:MAG TPA: 1,6-anhydro-N-acetylmuramyl-L-alanine amidase AmpD [Candidatus Methanoperedens sp.]|nr:1,6-anhydro-N-acetylmuramyl-L-alanine amidase AmpD [Candidatus Methanoperedens sp.]
MKTRFLPSPHQRDRGGAVVDMVVIHHITCPPGCFDPADVEALFLGTLDAAKHPAYREVEGRELSAHFLVDRRGRVTQFVPTDRAAFHAGASRWRGRAGCNDFSVGIELIGDADHAFTARQYAALARLCRALMRTHPRLTAGRIVGHSQVAWPRGRKQDPGPRFDWARFRALLYRPRGSAFSSGVTAAKPRQRGRSPHGSARGR